MTWLLKPMVTWGSPKAWFSAADSKSVLVKTPCFRWFGWKISRCVFVTVSPKSLSFLVKESFFTVETNILMRPGKKRPVSSDEKVPWHLLPLLQALALPCRGWSHRVGELLVGPSQMALWPSKMLPGYFYLTCSCWSYSWDNQALDFNPHNLGYKVYGCLWVQFHQELLKIFTS